MPISQAFFQRSNALLLAVGIAVLVVIVATSLWLTAASERYFGEVTAARAVRSASADLLSLVQDAETGQRGFLLTRDESYLEPYTAAVSRLADQRVRLEQAAARLREVDPILQRVTGALDRKMAELAATVQATRQGDVEAATALASVPALIRGYGHVRQASAEKAAGERARLLERLAGTPARSELQAAE